MKNFYVISMSQGGLAGRLRCLINSISISEKTDRKVLLYWEKNSACNCDFSDLFDNHFYKIKKEELRNIVKQKDFQIYKDRIDLEKKFVLVEDLIEYIDFSKVLGILKELKINKEIQKKVNEFKLPKKIIGIHIRKGDFKNIDVGIVSTDEKFIEEIRKEIESNAKVKFFLATEDKETEDKFKRIFGESIISYPKITREREDEGSVKEALIEMLLLSKCKKILGSFKSTFNEFAWYFGECKPELKTIINKKQLEIFNTKEINKESLSNKIKQKIHKIITPLDVRLLGRKK